MNIYVQYKIPHFTKFSSTFLTVCKTRVADSCYFIWIRIRLFALMVPDPNQENHNFCF